MSPTLVLALRTLSRFLALALVVGCLPVGGFAQDKPAPEAAPELVFKESAVEITGLTPGGQAAFLTVWREQGPGGTEVTILDEVVADDDGDGAVSVELERSVPELSVWAVVDVATGLRRIQAPASFEPNRRETRPGQFVEASALGTIGLSRAEVLVVRPGKDAFRAQVGDGGETDQDGETDGQVALSAAEVSRAARRAPDLEELPLPERFEGGDVLVAIDPRTLEVVELEVPGAAPNTAPAGQP